MCGRYALTITAKTLAEEFGVTEALPFMPRYNISPRQMAPVIRAKKDSNERAAALLRWGLIPSWAKDEAIGDKLINARAESVSEKPAFRSAFKSRRCLVPADAFYEWKKLEGNAKQPFAFRMIDSRPFAFAGLWETWNDEDGEPLETFAIVTTTPNELAMEVHDRMPVIIDCSDYARWLDPNQGDEAVLRSLLSPYPGERMRSYPVNRLVSSPKNDDPACLEPALSTDDLDNGGSLFSA